MDIFQSCNLLSKKFSLVFKILSYADCVYFLGCTKDRMLLCLLPEHNMDSVPTSACLCSVLHTQRFYCYCTPLLVLYDQCEEIVHLLHTISSSKLINVWCTGEVFVKLNQNKQQCVYS